MIKGEKMVYCPKCGLKNQEDATFCASCGASVFVTREKRPSEYEDMCFGRRDNSFMGIFFGAIILIFGFTLLMQQMYGVKVEFWSLFLVLLGVVIIVSGFRRRKT